MFDTFTIEQTPVFHQTYTQNYFEKPKTSNPITERRQTMANSTAARGIQLRSVANSAIGTATVADITQRRLPRQALDSSLQVKPEYSTANKSQQDRVLLLAKKYAGKLDPDASARLEILTQRMRLMKPRITAATIDRMQQMVHEVDDVTDGIAALRAKFQI